VSLINHFKSKKNSYIEVFNLGFGEIHVRWIVEELPYVFMVSQFLSFLYIIYSFFFIHE